MQKAAQSVKMPSFPTMANNLGASVARNIQSVASGNQLRVDSDVASQRLSICNGCEFFNKDQQRCGKCGCYMSVKTYLKAEKCPVGKW